MSIENRKIQAGYGSYLYEFNLFPLFILCSFLFPYIGGYLTFPLYFVFFIFLIKNIHLTYFDILFGLLVITFFFLKLIDIPLITCIQIFRVYFGFFFFYLVFKSIDPLFSINFNYVCIIISTAILAEALLINTVISPSDLNVFPNFATSTGKTAYFGFYQRPYSIGSNASVTSILLLISLSYATAHQNYFPLSKFTQYLSTTAIVSMLSGVGFFGLFLYFFSQWKKIYRLLFVTSIVIFYAMPFFSFSFFGEGIQKIISVFFTKISTDYIQFLWADKKSQVENLLTTAMQSQNPTWEILFGNASLVNGAYGGDFGWLDQAYTLGITGVLLTLIFTLSKINKKTLFPLGIFLLSAFHYSALISVIGQILFGYSLSLCNPQNEKKI